MNNFSLQNGAFIKNEMPFTQVTNSVLRNDNLSLKAKGLYSLIQSYITMDTFVLFKWFLLKHCVEGKKSFEGAWKELKDNGYLKQYRIRVKESNKYIYQYQLLFTPDLTTPSLVNIGINGEIIEPPQNGGGSNNDENEPPQNGGGSNRTGFKSDVVQNRVYNNNTDLNNTNQNNIVFNNHSINHEKSLNNNALLSNVLEPIDGMNKKAAKYIVRGELLADKLFPYWYAADKTRTTEAIHYMSDWDIFSNEEKDEYKKSVFILFNNALIDMCCSTDNPIKVKGKVIKYSEIIDKINEYAEFSDDYISISKFQDSAISDYENADRNMAKIKQSIKSPLNYMISCIWNSMQVGDIGMLSQIKRII